jgi:hypothetical protein
MITKLYIFWAAGQVKLIAASHVLGPLVWFVGADEQQTPHTWRVRCPDVQGFPDNAAANSSINGPMKDFMQNNNASQAQVSVAQGGRQLLNRAYTWDDAAEPTSEADDVLPPGEPQQDVLRHGSAGADERRGTGDYPRPQGLQPPGLQDSRGPEEV